MTDEEVEKSRRAALEAGVQPELLEYVAAMVRSWAPERQVEGQAVVKADLLLSPTGEVSLGLAGSTPIRLASQHEYVNSHFYTRSVVRTVAETAVAVERLERQLKEAPSTGSSAPSDAVSGATPVPLSSDSVPQFVSVAMQQSREHDDPDEPLGPQRESWKQTEWPRADYDRLVRYPPVKWDRHEEARYRILMAKTLNRTTNALIRCMAMLRAMGRPVDMEGCVLPQGPGTWQTDWKTG